MLAYAVGAVRRRLLTGCRRNEILRLRWDDVDRTAGELRIRDSKTGPRRVLPTAPVARVLARISRIEGNPWVITGERRGEPLKNINSYWRRLCERAGLKDLRHHDCRYSCAAYSSNTPYSLTLFFWRKIRKQIVTGVARIPGAACSASRATLTIRRNRAIPAIASFVAGLRYPGGSVSTMS